MTADVLAEVVTAALPELPVTANATATACIDAPAEAWWAVAEAVAAAGGQLDWLTGVDLGRRAAESDGEIQVVAMFIRDGDALIVRTKVGYSEPLPTLGDLFASATWHERETTEMLGVAFTGGDPRRLLLPEGIDGHPLRRDFPLTARLDTPWPGAEPGRRARVPGINPEWQQ